jgi:hypothetical protein
MGCGASATKVPYGVPMTEQKIINTWVAGVTKGEGCWERQGPEDGPHVSNKLQVWTEITFNEDKTCTATIVDCGNWERYAGLEWTTTPAEYVVLFRGSGTWSLWREGQKLKDGWKAKDDGVKIQFEKAFNGKGESIPADKLDELNDEDFGNSFSFLRWSGGAGCSLTWFWCKHKIDGPYIEPTWGTEDNGRSKQKLLPTEVDMENVDGDHYYGGCEYRGKWDSNSKYCYDDDYYKNYSYPPRDLGCEHVSRYECDERFANGQANPFVS